MAPKQGDFVWHELLTSDVPAAADYYAKVLGWSVRDAGLSGQDYRIFSVGETPVAGLMAVPEQAKAAGLRPRWGSYIAVDDVDATVEALKAAGGTLHYGPEDIPQTGRFASVADPQGVGFYLFRGDGGPPPEVPPGTPGTVGWNELHAVDGEAAFAFYAGLFGWTKDEAIPMGPAGVYQLFANGGPAIGGMMTKMDAFMPVATWIGYVNVDAIDAAAARATEAGGTIVHGPSEVPGGQWIAHGRDPQGALFAMIGPGR